MLKLAVLLFSLIIHADAEAQDGTQDYRSEFPVVGSGTLSYAFWDVYEATLYAPGGTWRPDQPFALKLHYLRSIDGEDIADRSAHEIRQQGFTDEVRLAGWYSQMKTIFPNVTNGTRLTGIYTPGSPTRFYHGNKNIGQIQDAGFAEKFFNIWLAENTSEPGLRRKLLGIQ